MLVMRKYFDIVPQLLWWRRPWVTAWRSSVGWTKWMMTKWFYMIAEKCYVWSSYCELHSTWISVMWQSMWNVRLWANWLWFSDVHVVLCLRWFIVYAVNTAIILLNNFNKFTKLSLISTCSQTVTAWICVQCNHIVGIVPVIISDFKVHSIESSQKWFLLVKKISMIYSPYTVL